MVRRLVQEMDDGRLCMQLSSLLMPSGERAGQSRCLVYLRVRCSNNFYPVWWHMVGEDTYSSMQ